MRELVSLGALGLGIINEATVRHFRHQLFKSVPSVMTVA